MRLLLIFSISLLSVTIFAQSKKLKKQQDYTLYYEKLFEEIPILSDKVINLHQSNLYFQLGMSRESKNMQYILGYLSDSCSIDEKLYYNLYNNWIINITSDTKNLYETGITESRKDKILKKSLLKGKDVVLTICPPFRLTESLVVLQFRQHCQGLCASHSVYIVEYIKEGQQLKILCGGVVIMQ